MDYKKYLKLGVNHHLLNINHSWKPEEHERSLDQLLGDDRFELLDVWIPMDHSVREHEIDAILKSEKQIIYNIGTRRGKEPAHPASLDLAKREYSLEFYKRELDSAVAANAKKVVTNSGPDIPDRRKDAFEALVDFYIEICRYVAMRSDMLILIEPTDRETDKRKLIGPSIEAVRLVKSIHQAGYQNFGSMIDMCHIPLMGETISQAMHETNRYIGHIHLGNCILRDKKHPLFGDKHVPIGIPEGEYAVHDVAQLLLTGLELGYFNKQDRGTVSLEMRPFEKMSPTESLDIYFKMFLEAWDLVVKQLKTKDLLDSD